MHLLKCMPSYHVFCCFIVCYIVVGCILIYRIELHPSLREMEEPMSCSPMKWRCHPHLLKENGDATFLRELDMPPHGLDVILHCLYDCLSWYSINCVTSFYMTCICSCICICICMCRCIRILFVSHSRSLSLSIYIYKCLYTYMCMYMYTYMYMYMYTYTYTYMYMYLHVHVHVHPYILCMFVFT